MVMRLEEQNLGGGGCLGKKSTFSFKEENINEGKYVMKK